jgi:hypothetical protein
MSGNVALSSLPKGVLPVSDPFAPSSDPDIPTPTAEDLFRLIHGEYQDQLGAGTLSAKVEKTLWADARRQWDDGHKREAERGEGATQDTANTPDKEDKGVPGARTGPKPARVQQQIKSQLLAFMSPQVRAAYDAADREQKQILLEATRRAFEEAEKRKEQRRRRELDLAAKALDMLQRIKEDPDKAHLLPPADASMQDLHDWYKEMSKPVRTVPFPGSIDAGAGTQSYSRPDYGNVSESQLRQDRIWHDLHRTGRADPEDIAEEEAEDERHERKLAEARERKRKQVAGEFGQPKQIEHKPANVSIETMPKPEGKFIAFIESNLTWGAFGVIVAGLATLISSAILLFFGWSMLTVSSYRHFFKGRSWQWQVFGTLFVGLMLGLALLVIWLQFRPH